jgi:hypothetical protein
VSMAQAGNGQGNIQRTQTSTNVSCNRAGQKSCTPHQMLMYDNVQSTAKSQTTIY